MKRWLVCIASHGAAGHFLGSALATPTPQMPGHVSLWQGLGSHLPHPPGCQQQEERDTSVQTVQLSYKAYHCFLLAFFFFFLKACCVPRVFVFSVSLEPPPLFLADEFVVFPLSRWFPKELKICLLPVWEALSIWILGSEKEDSVPKPNRDKMQVLGCGGSRYEAGETEMRVWPFARSGG